MAGSATGDIVAIVMIGASLRTGAISLRVVRIASVTVSDFIAIRV